LGIDESGAHLTHFDGERNAVQQTDSSLILTVFRIEISPFSNRDLIHGRDGDDRRLVFWQIEFFIFFFEIKRHKTIPHFR